MIGRAAPLCRSNNFELLSADWAHKHDERLTLCLRFDDFLYQRLPVMPTNILPCVIAVFVAWLKHGTLLLKPKSPGLGCLDILTEIQTLCNSRQALPLHVTVSRMTTRSYTARGMRMLRLGPFVHPLWALQNDDAPLPFKQPRDRLPGRPVNAATSWTVYAGLVGARAAFILPASGRVFFGSLRCRTRATWGLCPFAFAQSIASSEF